MTDPIKEIQQLVANLVAVAGPLGEGMRSIVDAVEKLEPRARELAARVTRPLMTELVRAVEQVAAPLQAAEQKLSRLSGEE